MAETTLKAQPIIEVENLTKRHMGAKEVLHSKFITGGAEFRIGLFI